jgi:exonuclease SbcD
MINLVWRTDVHVSDKAPASRTDDWNETIFGKLDQVRRIAEEREAVAILDGGDFFHIKMPGRNSHETVRRVMDHHANYPCPVFCTPGNHDSIYGDYAFLGQQPLGVLYAAGTFQRLYDKHEAVFKEEVDLEHLGHFTALKVRVVGIPYHGTTYDMNRFKSIQKGDEDILICVAHVLASPEGGSMFEGEDIVKYRDLLGTAPDVYCFGHWHKDQGVQIIEDDDGSKKTIINIGSLTRGALSQDEVQRRPACAVLKCSKQGVEVEVVRLKVKPAEEVFDVERRADQIRRQADMDTFVSKIRDSLTAQANDDRPFPLLSEPDSEDNPASSDIPAEVRERALYYLELADG